jgi:hypothetical protein
LTPSLQVLTGGLIDLLMSLSPIKIDCIFVVNGKFLAHQHQFEQQ